MLKTELERADGSLKESFWAKPREAALAGAIFDGKTKGVISVVDPTNPVETNPRRLVLPSQCANKPRSCLVKVQENATFPLKERRMHARNRSEIALDFGFGLQLIILLEPSNVILISSSF